MSAAKQFTYRAVAKDGRSIQNIVVADDRQDALRQLALLCIIPTDIRELRAAAAKQRKAASLAERTLALKQLAVMLSAGIELLDAIDTLITSLPSEASQYDLRALSNALKGGASLEAAFKENMRGYPDYVHALIAAGEATGDLGRAFSLAGEQISHEARTQSQLWNALTYPLFLLSAGSLALGLLFYSVVPTFADMLKQQNAELGFFENLIFSIALLVRAYPLAILTLIFALVFFVGALARRPAIKAAFMRLAETMPGISTLVMAKRRMNWARIMTIAIRSGVGVLGAAELAERAAPPSQFKSKLTNARLMLRGGSPVHECFAPALEVSDVGLLRVAQKTGALDEMFGLIAERYEDSYQNSVKRLSSLLEPIAVGAVSLIIGLVVLTLVTAMTSLYDSIG